MRRLAKPARIIGVLSIAVALAACSAIKLGYNTLPELATWWLDRHVDLGDEQEQRVREDFARLHRWHRAQELPRLVQLLQQAERLVSSDLTPAQACAFVPDVRARLTAVAEQAEPAAATLALSMTAAQIMHLERKYASNNREYRKEWADLPAAQQKEKRYDAFLERAESIYGRLDGQQRETLRRQADSSVFDPAVNLAERLRRQQDILQGLRQLAGQPVSLGDARSVVHGLLERGLRSPDLRYRTYQQALIEEGCRNVSALHQSTTPQQRENAVRRIRAYQRDLEELARQP